MQSICYGAQIKWFPHLKGFIQKHALISAKLAREAGDITGNLWKDRKVPPHRDTVSSVVSSNMLSFPACSKKVQFSKNVNGNHFNIQKDLWNMFNSKHS